MLKEKIQKDILDNLKSKNATEVKVLRFVLSLIKYAEIEKQKELSDEEIVSLMQKEVKKRKEAIELFKKGNRNDLVTDEENQIKVVERYLPSQLSDKELEKIIDETISGVGNQANIGKLIGMVMGKVKGKADGTRVAALIKEKLNNK